MKKITFLLSVILLLSVHPKIGAAPIDSTQAVTAAKHFFAGKTSLRSGQLPDVKIISVRTSTSEQIPHYYIISAQQQNGWIILSGDDRISPVIAYSEENTFNNETNPAFNWWMEEKEREITELLSAYQNSLRSTNQPRHREWTDLLSGVTSNEVSQSDLRSTTTYTSGTNLLAGITWNQTGTWASSQANNNPAGCVATAMGQVLKYWGRKNNITQLQGKGAYEYIDHTSNNAIRSVDFSTRVYNLLDMPENTSSQDIRDLLYDLGVSVRMSYSPNNSGAINTMIPSALFSHFGFKPAEYVASASYTSSRWEEKIKQEIMAERPVVYGGEKASGGHSFVISGHNTQTNTFYFNWGWSGLQNGWYVLSLTGVDNQIAYSQKQDAVLGIEPYTDGETYAISISDVTMISGNTNCFMYNKFTSGVSTGIFIFKLTNHTSSPQNVRLTGRFYSNSTDGIGISYGDVTYLPFTVQANSETTYELDAEIYIDYWNSHPSGYPYDDLNCDLGISLTNDDSDKYIVDIGRNPHVIRKVSTLDCETETSVPETTVGKLACHPNPAQDHIYIQPDGNITPGNISIINIFGEKQSPRAIETAVNGEIRIDISNLSNGIYFISTGKQTSKFIKQ